MQNMVEQIQNHEHWGVHYFQVAKATCSKLKKHGTLRRISGVGIRQEQRESLCSIKPGHESSGLERSMKKPPLSQVLFDFPWNL